MSDLAPVSPSPAAPMRTPSPPATPAQLSPAEMVQAFKTMTLARQLDDKVASLYRGGKISGGAFLGRGQEALSVALGQSLRHGDIYAPLIRDAAGRLAFGEPVLDAVRTYLGSALGPMRGRDGNVHRGRPREGVLPMISHLGAMIPVVNGWLMACRFKGLREVVGASCIGDGGTSTGAFHEGLNQAAVERLPLVVVIADNQFAYSTPTARQFACASLVDKAVGYGVGGYTVDGTDLTDCLPTVRRAVDSARRGEGPQLVVARLLRLCGHGEHDDASYVGSELKNSLLGRDCMLVAERQLLSQGWATAAEIETWRAEAVQTVENAVRRVQGEPGPDPYREDWSALATSHLRDAYYSG